MKFYETDLKDARSPFGAPVRRLIVLTDREEKALEQAKATGFWPEPLRRETLTDAEAREMAASEMYGFIGERVRPEAGGVTNEPGAIIAPWLDLSDAVVRLGLVLTALGVLLFVVFL